ncbi:hypothetical protein Sjap_011296 [Stephania japonica]|uniref:Uncharacterized protein n=1 Tax=Stephania japonica TaxID=461633 RepID=A0AAP0P5E9_9MAGN
MTVRETLAFSARVQGVGTGHGPYTSEADGSNKYESFDTISCTDSDFTYDTSSQTDEYFNSRMSIVVKGITQGGCITNSVLSNKVNAKVSRNASEELFQGFYPFKPVDKTRHETGHGEPVDGEIRIEKCKINVRVGLLSDIRVTKRSTHRGLLK